MFRQYKLCCKSRSAINIDCSRAPDKTPSLFSISDYYPLEGYITLESLPATGAQIMPPNGVMFEFDDMTGKNMGQPRPIGYQYKVKVRDRSVVIIYFHILAYDKDHRKSCLCLFKNYYPYFTVLYY